MEKGKADGLGFTRRDSWWSGEGHLYASAIRCHVEWSVRPTGVEPALDWGRAGSTPLEGLAFGY